MDLENGSQSELINKKEISDPTGRLGEMTLDGSAGDDNGDADVFDTGDTYTVEDALTSVGFGKFQKFLLFYAGFGLISEAMEMMLLSFVGPSVQIFWNLSTRQESLITSVVFVGELIGAYFWGYVSDNYGRRKGFLFTSTATAGAGLLSSFSPNYLSLLLFRFFVGFGLGGGHVLSSWFLEFVPPSNRGIWMVTFSIFWSVGSISAASLAWAVLPSLGWRWLLLFSSLPSFVLLMFFRIVPESPRFLSIKGRTAEALLVLEKVARSNQASLPFGTLVVDHQRMELEEIRENPVSSEDDHLIVGNVKSETVLVGEEDNKHTNKIVESGGFSAVVTLLSPDLAFSTILIWIVFFGNAFSYYGLVLLTSELHMDLTGCSPTAAHKSPPQNSNLYKSVLLTSFAELPGLLLAALLVDRIGRKMTMASMFFSSFIFLMPLLSQQSWLFTIILLFGARACISGSFTVIYIYTPEIYPTSVRSTGVGVASSVGRLGGILCPLVAIGLLHSCHKTISIIVFEFVMFTAGVAAILFPLETKGRQLKDAPVT